MKCDMLYKVHLFSFRWPTIEKDQTQKEVSLCYLHHHISDSLKSLYHRNIMDLSASTMNPSTWSKTTMRGDTLSIMVAQVQILSVFFWQDLTCIPPHSRSGELASLGWYFKHINKLITELCFSCNQRRWHRCHLFQSHLEIIINTNEN